MAYIVKLTNVGGDYFLRNTVWAFAAERATRYATPEDAKAGLEKARGFMKAAAFKAARIVEESAH